MRPSRVIGGACKRVQDASIVSMLETLIEERRPDSKFGPEYVLIEERRADSKFGPEYVLTNSTTAAKRCEMERCDAERPHAAHGDTSQVHPSGIRANLLIDQFIEEAHHFVCHAFAAPATVGLWRRDDKILKMRRSGLDQHGRSARGTLR